MPTPSHPSTSPLTLTRSRPQGTLSTRDFAVEAARLLADNRCTDVALLDVTGISSVADYIIIGSGTSDRQMRSTLDEIAQKGEGLGHTVVRKNSDDRATWLLADFGDLIVHLFEPNTRAYYDLEMLWGDAPRLPWERPATAESPAAKARASAAKAGTASSAAESKAPPKPKAAASKAPKPKASKPRSSPGGKVKPKSVAGTKPRRKGSPR
ncbi:MAG: ribosome silencing factor [Phycisphaeraceae bacterium]|nr:MAG: ribosome silencing factor [Phycisphaeraceae bacterium]